MKPQKIMLTGLPLAAFILEWLPNAAVLNFMNPEGPPFRETFSYFSLTPFGYANFGPLITAVLTVVLVILSLVYWRQTQPRLLKTIIYVSGFALVASLAPLLYGLDSYSVVGGLISVLLFIEWAFALSLKKRDRG